MAQYKYWMPYIEVGAGNREIRVEVNDEHHVYRIHYWRGFPVDHERFHDYDYKEHLFEAIGRSLGPWGERLAREADRLRGSPGGSRSGAEGDRAPETAIPGACPK
jgi:hypothetical protein